MLVARAAQLADLGRWDDLLTAAAAILAQAPDHVRALGWTAQAELARGGAGSATRALAAADAYAALRPHDEWGHRLRSVALLQLRWRAREAEAAAREAVRVGPDVPEAHDQLAAVLLVQRRTRAAQTAADERARLAPADPASHTLLADVATARRRYADAERHAREALRLAPTDPDAHDRLARALTGRGRTREAMEAAYEAARAAPSMAASRRLLSAFTDHLDRRVPLAIVGFYLALVLGAVVTSRVPLPQRRWVLAPILVVTVGGMFLAGPVMGALARRRTPPEVRRAVQALDPRGERLARLSGSAVALVAPLVFALHAYDLWRDPSVRFGPLGTAVYLAVVAAWAAVARWTWRSWRRFHARTHG